MAETLYANRDGRRPQADHLTEKDMEEIHNCRVESEGKAYTMASDFFELAHARADLEREVIKHDNLKRFHEQKLWHFKSAVGTIDAIQIARKDLYSLPDL